MSDENVVSKEEFERRQREIFEQLLKLRLVDLTTYPYRLQERIIGTYTREDLKKYLKAPELEVNQKQLRKISRFLYNASSHYKRLVQYFAQIATLDYTIEPVGLDVENVNIKKFKKAYQKTVNLVETMNIKHEFSKVMHSVFMDGVYHGYILRNSTDFMLLHLDPDYVKITFIEDSCYGIAFNFIYFNIYPERLAMFPPEFKEIYDSFAAKNGGKIRRGSTYWADLNSDNTITIKFDEHLWYPVPVFTNLFDAILEIEDFKELEKTKTQIGLYKLLAMKIPIKDKTDGYNDYLITLDHAIQFQNNLSQALPDQIGAVALPFEVNPIDFERDKPDINKVAQSTQQMYSQAGVSQLLFASEGATSASLIRSIQTDEALTFTMLRQIERWINKFLKIYNKGTYRFRVRMLNTTVFNKDDYVDQLLNAAQYGLPVITELIGVLGHEPSSIESMNFVEQDLLQLSSKLKPLLSSHTTPGGTDQGGRPQKKETDLTEAGTQTKETDQNDNR